MEDIRRTALALYEASSDEVKQLAFDLFKKCDHDEDGKVKFRDLLEFFEQGGYGGVKPSFFEELGKGQDDLLDFEETIVVYYVVKTTNIKQDDSKIADSTSSETPKTAEHAQLKVIEEKFINQNIIKAPFQEQFPGTLGLLDVSVNNNSIICNIL